MTASLIFVLAVTRHRTRVINRSTIVCIVNDTDALQARIQSDYPGKVWRLF